MNHFYLKFTMALFLIIVLNGGCSFIKSYRNFQKVKKQWQYHDSEVISLFTQKIVNSLATAGKDTALVLSKRCSGCIPGYPSADYIIYMDSVFQTKLIVIDNFRIQYYDDVGYFSLPYFLSLHQQDIKTYKEIGGVYLSHYRYQRLNLFINNQKQEMELIDYKQYEGNPHLVLDKIKASLFDYLHTTPTLVKTEFLPPLPRED